MTFETIKKQGEYLGFCEMKGYIYSVFRGHDKKGCKLYSVVAVKDNQTMILITFSASH